MRFSNWKIKRLLRKKVRQNQKLRPITLKNIFKQTGIKNGSRDRYRELVRIRDNHTCQLCDKEWEKGKRKLDIHHIKGDFELSRKCDKNFNNQITLCHSCHLQVDGWKMRYIKFYQKIIINIENILVKNYKKTSKAYTPIQSVRRKRKKLINERDKEIYKLRKSGLTYQAIGDKYGVSRQRIEQIHKKVINFSYLT